MVLIFSSFGSCYSRNFLWLYREFKLNNHISIVFTQLQIFLNEKFHLTMQWKSNFCLMCASLHDLVLPPVSTSVLCHHRELGSFLNLEHIPFSLSLDVQFSPFPEVLSLSLTPLSPFLKELSLSKCSLGKVLSSFTPVLKRLSS